LSKIALIFETILKIIYLVFPASSALNTMFRPQLLLTYKNTIGFTLINGDFHGSGPIFSMSLWQWQKIQMVLFLGLGTN
jgi:hypothetical protein